MATYKVIQDIEAEDKLFGPFSLKQFGYAIIAGSSAFLIFQLIVRTELGVARWFGVLMFLPPCVLFAVLASPLGRDQPTEVWLLARIRFMIKPRIRKWDQSGLKELVTITVPKKIEKIYTDGLSQSEVKSRLNALATTLDSRGWAVKNVSVNLSVAPGYGDAVTENSDRLVAASALPQSVPLVDVRPEDDIMDANSNSTAHHFDELVKEASEHMRKQANTRLEQARQTQPDKSQQADFWFMNQEAQQTGQHTNKKHHLPLQIPGPDVDLTHLVRADISTVRPGTEDHTKNYKESDAEKKLLEELHHKKEAEQHFGQSSHLKRLPTLDEQKKQLERQHQEEESMRQQAQQTHFNQIPQMTAEQQADILRIANNDDISVATAGKQAKRKLQSSDENDGMVEIKLR